MQAIVIGPCVSQELCFDVATHACIVLDMHIKTIMYKRSAQGHDISLVYIKFMRYIDDYIKENTLILIAYKG